MIFKGHIELNDQIEYIKRITNRKIDFYRSNNIPFEGINQIEFIIREVLERVYDIHSDYPSVDVKEEGDLSISRNKIDLKPRSYSQKWTYGYRITMNTDTAVFLGRNIGEIFEDTDFLQKRNQMKGYEPKLHIYQKPIYVFSTFERYQVCKKEIISFILNISLWYISLHEYAHIINGHCDIIEEHNAKIISLNIEQIRALEIHADLMAAELLFDVLKSWEKYVGVSQIVPRVNGKNPGLSFFEEIVFATISVYICMRSFWTDKMWDEWSIGVHEMKGESHPLTELRMAIVSDFLLNKLLDIAKSKEERDSLINQYFSMITQFEAFLFENTANKPKCDDVIFYNPTQLIRTKEGKEYFKKIFDTIIGMNDWLESYMLIPNTIVGQWKDYEVIPYVSSPIDGII